MARKFNFPKLDQIVGKKEHYMPLKWSVSSKIDVIYKFAQN